MAYLVYKHTCPNGKVYIGITSQSAKERWRNNGLGYKKNKHFFNAILKYGWDNIKHEIIFDKLAKEKACKKEIELIAFYKSNQREYGYNSAIGGEINKGFNRTSETKEKLRLANLGKPMSEEIKRKISAANKGKSKPAGFGERIKEIEQSKAENILQVDFSGNIVFVYPSIQEASRKTSVPATKICAVCKGKRKYAKGYIWLYEKDKDLINERVNKIKGCA